MTQGAPGAGTLGTTPAESSGKARRLLHLGLIAAMFALILVLGIPVCPMANVLGVPCPGCGLTRATLALLSGDLRGAIALHPLVLVLPPILAVVVSDGMLRYVRGPNSRGLVTWRTRSISWLASILLVLLIGVWLARFAGAFGGPAPVQSLFERSGAR